jgi:hypothetical protein
VRCLVSLAEKLVATRCLPLYIATSVYFNLVWEISQVINLGSISVGNATLVVANVLT